MTDVQISNGALGKYCSVFRELSEKAKLIDGPDRDVVNQLCGARSCLGEDPDERHMKMPFLAV
jgi:hypothetical protein